MVPRLGRSFVQSTVHIAVEKSVEKLVGHPSRSGP